MTNLLKLDKEMVLSRPKDNAILLLSCPDRKGIVAGISEFIYKNDGNIVHADQHTDPEKGVFFMRIEWELPGFKIPREELSNTFAPLANKFDMEWDLRFSDHVPPVALFVSKHDHCLYDLLLRHKAGEFQAEIPLIISNHPDLRPVAESFGIKYLVYPITKETKATREKEEIEQLRKHGAELIILARYMQILSREVVSLFANRIINIHHSFLPAFARAKPYKQAYNRGVKIIGATSHYVTEDLDEGPIIEQDIIRVSHRDTVEDLMRKGRDIEKVVLARAVRLHLENKVLVYGNKTVIFD
jgi:formyltetrahydrofolate deformylase